MTALLEQLLTVRVALDGVSCECTCGCSELADLDLRRPGKEAGERLCVECLAAWLRSRVALNDMLEGLAW
jgi:hypothetical protein